MALRELVEGECGAANPLVQWRSHMEQQKTLNHGGVGGDRLGEIARHPQQQLQDQYVDEFLGERRLAVPQTFNMSSLLTEIQQSPLHTLTPPPLTHLTSHNSNIGEWVDEFAPSPHSQSSTTSASWVNDFSNTPPADDCRLAHDWSEQFAPSTEEEKWVEEFKGQVESKGLVAVATELSESVTDPKIQATEFMKFVRELGGKTGDAAEVKGEAMDEKWVRDYEGEKEEEEERDVNDAGYWGQLEKEWEELSKQNSHPWLEEFSKFNEHEKKEYSFQENNHLKEVQNPLERGKKELREGNLPAAVLLFEAEVQKNPDSIEGWQYLGVTQANNEQELAAIAALSHCLTLSPSNLPAHLALAVSYTNESQQKRALGSLRSWLYHNPKYRHLVPEDNVTQESRLYLPSLMTIQEHEDVCKLFLQAAQSSPEVLDPDIQECLGILYNLSGEFDRAVDCFTAALHARPEDALLWNKLGATLANSDRSEEAVHAYRTALAHMPGFTRCRYNLGISCINLRAYREAVEHFLSALDHQRQATAGEVKVGGVSQMSDQIWSTLRLAISFLGQTNLIPILEERNLDTLLVEFGLAGKK